MAILSSRETLAKYGRQYPNNDTPTYFLKPETKLSFTIIVFKNPLASVIFSPAINSISTFPSRSHALWASAMARVDLDRGLVQVRDRKAVAAALALFSRWFSLNHRSLTTTRHSAARAGAALSSEKR